MDLIEIQQPRPYDLVDDEIQVAGQAAAFEATIHYRLTDGHDELTGFFTAGGAVAVRQFQTTISGIEATAMKQPLMFLSLFELSPRDGSEQKTVTVPVIYGTFLLGSYAGWQPYTVQSDDTLSGIAASVYGDSGKWRLIHVANQHVVPNPDLIFPGQELRIPRS
jgi:nucleoid-associated protein YgaU